MYRVKLYYMCNSHDVRDFETKSNFYLKTGGRKHSGCLKSGKTMSNLYENQKSSLKHVQYLAS